MAAGARWAARGSRCTPGGTCIRWRALAAVAIVRPARLVPGSRALLTPRRPSWSPWPMSRLIVPHRGLLGPHPTPRVVSPLGSSPRIVGRPRRLVGAPPGFARAPLPRRPGASSRADPALLGEGAVTSRIWTTYEMAGTAQRSLEARVRALMPRRALALVQRRIEHGVFVVAGGRPERPR